MLWRMVLGVLAGDILFAGLTTLLFFVCKVDPHGPASPGFVLVSIFSGIVFALVSGYVAGLIGQRADLIVGMVLAVVIAVGALVSLVSRPGRGAVWTQVSVLLLMVPAAMIGDYLRKQRSRS